MGHLKKFVALTPVEYDHYGESNPVELANASEKEARDIYPDLVHVESDIVFGKDSGVLTMLLKRIASGQNICLTPSEKKVSPIHSADLGAVVNTLLGNNSKGEGYLAKGDNSYTWKEIVDVLEGSCGKNASLSTGIISPLSNNVISELLFSPAERNLAQLINKYEAPNLPGYKDLASFKLKLKKLEEEYAKGKVNLQEYSGKDNSGERLAKLLFI